MTPKERIAADRANFRQQRATVFQNELAQEYAEPSRDERVKTNVDFQRNKAIGEMVIEHFPDLQFFHPQRNESANATEFKQFDDFLAAIVTLKDCYDALQKTINDKMAERDTGEPQGAQTGNM